MAYDYISKNIIWTDPLYHRITIRPTMSDDLENFHVLINVHLDYPVAIAVDPSERQVNIMTCIDGWCEVLWYSIYLG